MLCDGCVSEASPLLAVNAGLALLMLPSTFCFSLNTTSVSSVAAFFESFHDSTIVPHGNHRVRFADLT